MRTTLDIADDVLMAVKQRGPRQVTDAYLLALAVERGGRFVTFDRSIPLSAAPGATPEHLVVV